jgi:hypothetical protein
VSLVPREPVANKHLFWRDAIPGKGPLILRGLRERFQRGFWRMPWTDRLTVFSYFEADFL